MQEENKNLSGDVEQTNAQIEKKACLAKFKCVFGKKKVWMTAVAFVLLVLLAGVVYQFKSLVIAATVNGQLIYRLAVVKELEKQGGKDALNTIISKQLIENEVKAKGITVSQEEISQEIKKYEEQFNANGHTLDETLAAQNMTRDDLKDRVVVQKEILKLLGDKAAVTDEEVSSFIKENNITLPQGQEDATKSQIIDQLQQQKLSDGSGQLISELKAKANIKIFVNY